MFMRLFSNTEFSSKVAENGQPARFELLPLTDFLTKITGKFLAAGTREHNLELITKFCDKTGIIIFIEFCLRKVIFISRVNADNYNSLHRTHQRSN